MANEKTDVLLEVEEKWSRLENYFQENKKRVTTVVTVLLLVIAGYAGFKFWYLPGQEDDAELALYPAQRLFSIDSVRQAIPLFEQIADDYGWTKAGHTANYYLGICYYKTKSYDKAIDCLEKFDAGDVMVSPIAVGVMGDAEMQLGHTDQALEDYLKAVKRSANDLTTPFYMKKAAFAYELKGDYAQALSMYQNIKTQYHSSQEAQDIEKYIARAQAKSGTSAQ
jgi:tetratricopeptide (TPR) repeat protein